jgi:Leucine-rich repeat (LRR) protein
MKAAQKKSTPLPSFRNSIPALRQCVDVVGYALRILKLISNIFNWPVLSIVACSTTTTKSFVANRSNIDTTYTISTQQLKSNNIPDSVFQMINLRHLAINGMDCDNGNRANCWMIKEIPTEIKNLQNLTTLSLTLNAIKTIPNELAELNNLKLIDLTDNAGLSDVDNIAKIKGLEYLYLYGCGFTKLPDNIGNLKNLKELGLVGNNLDKTEQTRIKKNTSKLYS